MTQVRYCGNCERYVTPQKKFNWWIFILGGLISWGLISLIYLIYYFAVKKAVCPICMSDNWSIPIREEKDRF